MSSERGREAVRETGEDRIRHQRGALQRALDHGQLTTDAVWRRYFALGGSAGPIEVEAFIAELLPLPAVERDALAQAVNELLEERVRASRVPFSQVLPEPYPDSGPFGALLDALAGMHMAPPERLPTVAAAAGAALDVDLAVYLVDYEQDRLHPLPGPHVDATRSLGVDTSLAGRAFREVRILASRSEGQPRLWVPLLDGVERVGVLEAVPRDEENLEDHGLQRHLTWLAALLGHLVSVTTDYGDGLDMVRRTRPRDAAAELVWNLLPSLTAGTEKVVVSGMVEPCYTVGGDVFDHAVSETTAHLAIFDATGHSLESGLASARALSAYRSARRDGRSLFDQAVAVDQVARVELDQNGRFVTSVLAELDLDSGRLRYLNAGHPYPLVVRDGRVVKALTGGRRPVFGLPYQSLEIGEEILQPGDWLVLYTDGIVEARDEDGSFFGIDRLEDFLERETLADHPPPEMVRRLIKNVLSHQHGVLQDDASVLVARWANLVDRLTPPRSGALPPPVTH